MLIYHTLAIITRGLYIYYPILEDNFFVFMESLCMVSFQKTIYTLLIYVSMKI